MRGERVVRELYLKNNLLIKNEKLCVCPRENCVFTFMFLHFLIIITHRLNQYFLINLNIYSSNINTKKTLSSLNY